MAANPADLVFCNARVITYEANSSLAEAVAVRAGRISAVGTNSETMRQAGPDTRIIDCQGLTMVPGFNDAHCHPIYLAMALLQIDCSARSVKDIAGIQALVREQAQVTPAGKWLRAAQYNECDLAEKRHPTRWELDVAAPGHPVILTHYTAGLCVLNTLALKLAGIAPDTTNGIIFGRNEKVQQGVPPISSEELVKGIVLASQQYLACGITSLQDTSWNNELAHWQTYLKIKSQEGLLPCRVSMLIGIDSLPGFISSGLYMGSGDSQLRIGGVKLALDEKTGNPHPPQADLDNAALLAHLAGFQIAFHVHDQQGLRSSLKSIEFALSQTAKPLQRHRLEHCVVCSPSEISLMQKNRPVVVTQPAFLYYNGDDFMETVPPDQLNCLFPLNSMKRSGLQLAFSSDSPMIPSNPMLGIYAAVVRKTMFGQDFAPEEGISVTDALQMYTFGGAYASGEENSKGSLTCGKFADLVLLDLDPNLAERDTLRDIKVMMTVIDGKIVWQR